MKPYEHIQEFKIKYCDVDFKDEMKVSAALAIMEEVAGASADELGIGYAYLKPFGYGFVVSNICIEFLRPVLLGERVLAKTWPLPAQNFSFRREYQFASTEGEILVNAASRWCLLDMKEGKLLPSNVIDNQDYSTYNTRKLFEEVKWRLPVFKMEEGELRFTLKIANSEYDHNMHVNNTRYAEYCFNCFTVAELAERRVKKFSISYLKQCREGETLSFYRKKTEDGGYLAHGFNEAGEFVVQSLIYFEE